MSKEEEGTERRKGGRGREGRVGDEDRERGGCWEMLQRGDERYWKGKDERNKSRNKLGQGCWQGWDRGRKEEVGDGCGEGREGGRGRRDRECKTTSVIYTRCEAIPILCEGESHP